MPRHRETQWVSAQRLEDLAHQLNFWEHLHRKDFREVEQARDHAYAFRCGVSRIISFYDGLSYVGTIHQIISSHGQIQHQHLKDLLIGNILYKPKPRRKRR